MFSEDTNCHVWRRKIGIPIWWSSRHPQMFTLVWFNGAYHYSIGAFPQRLIHNTNVPASHARVGVLAPNDAHAHILCCVHDLRWGSLTVTRHAVWCVNLCRIQTKSAASVRSHRDYQVMMYWFDRSLSFFRSRFLWFWRRARGTSAVLLQNGEHLQTRINVRVIYNVWHLYRQKHD